VLGHRKVVYVPEDDSKWYFDLDVDPGEREPLVLDSELQSMLGDVHDLVNAHRTRKWKSDYEEMRRLGRWWCLEGDGVCLHPRAYKTKYRYAESRERPVGGAAPDDDDDDGTDDD
jgi:hypothetical protein